MRQTRRVAVFRDFVLEEIQPIAAIKARPGRSDLPKPQAKPG